MVEQSLPLGQQMTAWMVELTVVQVVSCPQQKLAGRSPPHC